jgi:PAS domain S-box-containing protein
MVEKNIQTEIFLELVFSASGEIDEQLILKKSIPFYLRKLNCFQAGVLKNSGNILKETMLIPFVAGKSKEWAKVKAYFKDIKPIENGPCFQLLLETFYYYAFCLSTYGILILGRKKPFDDTFTNELMPIVNHLGKFLIQAKEIKQRKKVEKSLRESEQRLRTLADTTSAGILIFHDEKIIYANPASEKFSGYSNTELMALNTMDLVHPDFKKQILELRNANQSGEHRSTHFEIKILRKDREERWLDISVGLINWMGQQANIISAFDTTKRKQAEEDLIKAKEKAEESDKLKTAFLENIAHEIRTPMNSILGFSKLLLKLSLVEEKRNQFTDNLHKSTYQLLKVVDNSITLAQIETNQLQINKMDFCPTILLSKLFKQYNSNKHRIEKSHIKLILNNPEFADFRINNDYTRIDQIFNILLDNAFKFTENGTIEFGYNIADNKINFYVKDTGIGIPSHKQKFIFKSFTQADKNIRQLFGGLGVGLAIALSLVKLLEGKLIINSQVNVGTEIIFCLPLLQELSQS